VRSIDFYYFAVLDAMRCVTRLDNKCSSSSSGNGVDITTRNEIYSALPPERR